jgi:phenylalanyl-tRNA synthetase beta subunit
MKVSSSWVQKRLRRTISNEQIVQALESAGIEVEQINASSEIDKRIISALVKEVVQHPAANRLKIAKVWTGESEYDVVCGAPNVRAGLVAPFAQIGSVLPSGDKILRAKLRGEVSEGMLCSARELGLGDDHDGLLELPQTTKPGIPLCDIYPADAVIDVKTPANRWDVMSVVGLAREVAAFAETKLLPLPSALVEKPGKTIKLSASMQADRYMAAIVHVKPDATSPLWMQAALRAVGIRPISLVVDVTNYCMIDLGQPLHAFDAEKVIFPVGVRHARGGERLTTIDGVERRLVPDDLVVVDASGPIALAGVMGGQRTEVTAATSKVLLEAAVFDASSVRKSAQRHGLRTEASARFERSLPVQLAPLALSRALELLETPLVESADQLNLWPWTQRIGLPVYHLHRLMGVPVQADEAVRLLGQLEIPAERFDITNVARALIGKSYKYGASYKKDGISAFDCSYLVDYVYSLIGEAVGFSALGQYVLGRPVPDDQLLPGDCVFVQGDKSDIVQDHYYTRSSAGEYHKHEVSPKQRVGHVGLYVGSGRVVHASPSAKKVVEVDLGVFTKDPHYLGARRFVEDLADWVSVPEVPWWRSDLKLPEDLIEEVARVYGYDRIPSTIPAWRPQTVTFDRVRPLERRVRELMYAAGLFEIKTYSFVSAEQLQRLNLPLDSHLKLKNPLSSEQAYLRSTMLPSHLAVLHRNRAYAKQFGLYEISRVFEKRRPGDQPDEPLRLAITLIQRDALSVVRGILDAVMRELNVNLELTASEDGNFAPGRFAQVALAGRAVGRIGQIHPGILGDLKLEEEVAYLEFDLLPVTRTSKPRQYQPAPRFPVIQRDITLVVPVQVSWADIQRRSDTAALRYVGEYYGDDLPAGHKAITVRLVISRDDRTPTEEDASEAEAKLVTRLARTLGATRRG